MIRLPSREAVARTAEQRRARGAALGRALGSVDAWSDEERFEVAERAAIVIADGAPAAEAERLAIEAVRAELLRRAP